MCRLYGFHSNELTKVECSLVRAQNALLRQNVEDETGREHAGGWGIACYSKKQYPELVRHKTVGFGDTAFSHQAESVFARTVVAHVRLATVGAVGPLNSHPFTYDNWTFAHNGAITGFEQINERLERETNRMQDSRVGSTDSEQFFLWMMNRLVRDGIDLDQPQETLVIQSLCASVGELDTVCRQAAPDRDPMLTFVLTNGQLIFGCRWNSPLHFLERVSVHDCEICGVPHVRHTEGAPYRAVVFASEPITKEAWTPIRENTIVGVNSEFQVEELCQRDKAKL